MKKTTILFTIFIAMSFVGAMAQVTPLTPPVGIGISSTPEDLHIHESVATDPGSIIEPGRDGNPQYNYITTLRMTNSNTGTGASDGFLIQQYNKDMTMRQYEKGSISIQANNGTGLKLDTNGRMGVGVEPASPYRLKVAGKTYLDGNIVSTGSLTAASIVSNGALTAANIAATGSLTAVSGTLSGGLTVAGNTTLGNGFTCSYDGHVRAKEVRVTLTGWSDFVFDDGYRLPTLVELEEYVRQNRHLPGIPGEAEAMTEGVDLGEMNARLLQKIEELTLYVIDLQKQINELKQKN